MEGRRGASGLCGALVHEAAGSRARSGPRAHPVAQGTEPCEGVYSAAMRTTSLRALAAILGYLLTLCVAGAETALAQRSDGTELSAGGGALLGMYSGAALGLTGGLLPCDRTTLGPGCPLVTAVAGGTLGLIAGGLLGSEDAGEIRERGTGALYGLLIGGFVGSILQGSVRQYGWSDAVVVAGVGAAVGAAPRGTLVGTGVGAAVGGLAWALSPRGGIQDLIMFTMVGAALGGLYDWVDGVVQATDRGGSPVGMTFSVVVG